MGNNLTLDNKLMYIYYNYSYCTFHANHERALYTILYILTDPQFLILDEPTNGLDPDGINELLDLIRSLKAKGMTILVSSHQLLEISKVADHILILDKGKIQYDGENKNVDSLERHFFNIVHGG